MGNLTYLHNFSINLKLFQNKGLFVKKKKKNDAIQFKGDLPKIYFILKKSGNDSVLMAGQ